MPDRPHVFDGLTADQAVGHVASLGAILGAAIGYLPHLAGFVAFLWYVVNLWETKTVQKWVRHRRLRRRAKRRALHAKA